MQRLLERTAGGLFVDTATLLSVKQTIDRVISSARVTDMTSAGRRGPVEAPRASGSLQDAHVGCRAARGVLHDCSPCTPVQSTLSPFVESKCTVRRASTLAVTVTATF